MAKLISVDLTNNKLCILEYTTTDGQMLSFKEDAFDAKIVSHTYADKGKIIFDKPITAIREFPFNIPVNLKSITIPDGVTTIGECAFWDCTSLTNVTIPNGVTTIGKWAFAHCESLTSISIPNSVTTIGYAAFGNCKSLTNVTIPNGVTTIGYEAFRYCDSLKEFKGKFAADNGRCLIVDGVLNSFAIGCGATDYTIPNSVTTIGNSAFGNCKSLTSITIPNIVTTIGHFTFFNCSSLTNITIPNSVTTIGDGAFDNCKSLTSVTIGKGVSVIGEDAFQGCNIDTIVCCAKIPPKLYNSFDKFENLIVPTGCEEAYANSDWGKYLE